MKTKTFLLLCLFLGIRLTQISGQGHAISHSFQEEMSVPLSCNVNTPPILLTAVFDVHCVMFNTGEDLINYSDWDQLWMKMRYKGTVTNPLTKEVFTVDEVITSGHFGLGTANTDPNYYPETHFDAKLKGNMGSHIIISGIFDWTSLDSNDWVFTIDKAICN
jgi:hypothetical protein